MTGCVCSCDYDVELPEDYSDSFPVARKTHTCCECGQTIKPGQKYNKFTGRWDGVWQTFRTCMACYNIRQDYCECAPFGGLQEALWEMFGLNYVTGETGDEDDEESDADGRTWDEFPEVRA